MKRFFSNRWLALTLLVPGLAAAQTQSVVVTVASDRNGPELPPHFLGLSYESAMVLPKDGRYYFDLNDQALVNTFQTLGIESLRVGANAVDNPQVAIPQERDIDKLFRFARAAGAKVIYSFRLKNGDPINSARLARHIAMSDADVLDCFSIGNEPGLYLTNFAAYYAQWKPHYDAILRAVPTAMFDAPSVSSKHFYALDLAKALFAGGHLKLVSDHYYFLGSGRKAEQDPAATRARFLSNLLHDEYEKDYARIGAVLAAQGVPYRLDEMNSCFNGGAKDASDTYASTLWALDCIHWWAAHHILGMNFHTGEFVGRDGGFGAASYAAFVHQPDGRGFVMRPLAYAMLAFNQGARGRSLSVNVEAATNFNCNAYAWLDRDRSIYVTLINKSYGDNAQPMSVSFRFPESANSGTWQRMDLTQENQDVAAKTGLKLGNAFIDPQGTWSGQWMKIASAKSDNFTVQVPAASATILHFTPAK